MLCIPVANVEGRDVVGRIVAELCSARGMAAHVEAAPGGSSAVLAEPPRSLLETVAEVVELPKLSAEHGVLTPFTVEQRLQFSNISDPAFFTRSERDVLGHFVIKHMAFRSSDQVDALFGACADVERREALRERVQAGAPILASLAEAGLTEEPVPIHDDGKRREMMRRWFFSLSPPEEEVAAYFGSEVAFYFAWLSHFTR